MAKREQTPKTVRAAASYSDKGKMISSITKVYAFDPKYEPEVPVIIVPESAVRGCQKAKHIGAMITFRLLGHAYASYAWCSECGAFYDRNKGRWQRPRVLRAGR